MFENLKETGDKTISPSEVSDKIPSWPTEESDLQEKKDEKRTGVVSGLGLPLVKDANPITSLPSTTPTSSPAVILRSTHIKFVTFTLLE